MKPQLDGTRRRNNPCVGYGSNRPGDAPGQKMATRILVQRHEKMKHFASARPDRVHVVRA
jgi:hypothetical protein